MIRKQPPRRARQRAYDYKQTLSLRKGRTAEHPVKRISLTRKEYIADYTSDHVVVLLMQSGQELRVHKNRFVQSSRVARTALSKVWDKSGTKHLELYDLDEDTFTTYLDWLEARETAVTFDSRSNNEWVKLIDLYMLGNSLGDEAFQNAIMDAFIEAHRLTKRSPVGYAEWIYGSVLSSDCLRRLLVDLYVYGDKADPVSGAKENHEFGMDMLRKMAEHLKKGTMHESKPWDVDKCLYHTHADRNEAGACEAALVPKA